MGPDGCGDGRGLRPSAGRAPWTIRWLAVVILAVLGVASGAALEAENWPGDVPRAATNGYLDPVPVEQVRAYELELYKFLDTRRAQLLQSLAKTKAIDDTIKPELNAALEEFGKSFAAANKTAA